MTYGHKCSVVGCNEPVVVVIPEYRDVSKLHANGILHVSNAYWCKQHAP